METVEEFTKKMRCMEALACPAPDDVRFFNNHIRDLGPGSNYRENLENIIRLRGGRVPDGLE